MEHSLSDVGQRARRRIGRRLLPFLFILYVVAILDRVNVAYAALQMSHDLHFNDRVFGLGAGIFFFGYLLLEIPGALIVERWSARRWIARILISWGLITVLIACVNTAREFYVARFFLGAAEAGFFPGIVVYLTHWFRYEDRAKAVAAFMSAIPVSNIIGSPLAGFVLGVHWFNLQGWRWLFILEGIPAIILGAITLAYLTDWPRQASWLRKDECDWITDELEREKQAKKAVRTLGIGQALRQPAVIHLTLVYLLGSTGFYGFVIWFQTVLKRISGLSDFGVGSLASVAYVAAFVAMLANGWHSDLTSERRWHTAFPLLLAAAVFLALIPARSHLLLEVTLLTCVGACVQAFYPTFWPIPTMLLGESAAAASIGLINSVGGLGGFAGPYGVGYLAARTSSFSAGFAYLAVSVLLSALLLLSLRAQAPFKSAPQNHS
jgi:ACS family tartrate transporter-like MFS transporter